MKLLMQEQEVRLGNNSLLDFDYTLSLHHR